ncbi:hypothetical protein [Nostoc sp. LEGE 12450]|jgi:hypothetical protein|uniref:hypothetical protein n=1 Tax=Nostoc sp. LEGE 12450 TaxID=1828643 RepID=UPI001880C38F|nr:hypothetical protein [Nostoc sp. LEGE 12450]MBE8990638.1 hypothetical protein [Nostoc sp. LEGE 12450]
MTTYQVRVDIGYSYFPRLNETFPYSYSPEGCFSGGYSYRLGNNGNDLYLVHADGEVFLGSNWSGYEIRGFTVVQISACDDPIEKYDCINGACIKANVYDTPGIHESLSECETACGTGCSGKCISNSDWAQIEGLSGQLKNRNCS